MPFVQTVHDRLNVEIQRGCPWRCRFCQAGFTYQKYRERTAAELVQIIEQGLRNTGYDAVTLAGLSAADHREIVQLLQALSEKFTPQRIAIGLPSTRADRFTLALADLLQTVRRQSLTFAPEAGTERLRRVIRKELQESEIRETLKRTYEHGWKSVKLYFMYGLPTETQADLNGIAEVVRHSRRENRGLSIACTLSPFVPKPHTPYQWHPQGTLESHREKLAFLRKNLSAQIRAHGLEQIVVEGVLARGDRRCSELLEKTWRMGCKFDEWSERFQFSKWQQVFQESGLNPEFYCYRQRSEDEVLPWDHLQGGPDKKALWNDYQTALRQAAEPVPETPHLKARPAVPELSPESIRKAQTMQEQTVQRLRFKIARHGSVRFTSHLEQIEMVRRTLRRAGLPMAFTSGFHPQMKCAFGPAISVGYESECEFFDVDFSRRVDVEEVRRSFAANLPEGFSLLKVSRIPQFFPSLESLVNRVAFEVSVPQSLLDHRGFSELPSPQAFLDRDPVLEKNKVSKSGKPVTVAIPLKPLMVKMEWMDASAAAGPALSLALKFGPGKNAKPEKIVSLFLQLSEEESRQLRVNRKGFYIERQDGGWTEP